jgi:hypothetical protein
VYARIATILALIEETPDAAIEELRQALTKKGVTFGYGTIRRLFARPWAAIGRMVDLFTPAESRNYFAPAGYDANMLGCCSNRDDGAPLRRNGTLHKEVELLGIRGDR